MILEDLNTSQLLDKGQGGDPEAQFLLGCRYYAGSDAPQDFTAAADWFEKSALLGYARAQFNLGHMYEKGDGLTSDACIAMRWYAIAAEQGPPSAQNNLARLYERSQQYDEAAHWYRRAADQGLASAQAKAANNGHPAAVENKRHVPVDHDDPICQLITAAAAGGSEAQPDLALRLYKGAGIQQDAECARYWLRKAAESGDPRSQTTYAIQLESIDHPGLEQEKVRWLSLAAAKGYDRALFNLGKKQVHGEGTTADPESGAVNLLRASLAGFTEARAAIAIIKSALPAEAWVSVFDRVKWPQLTLILGWPVDESRGAVHHSKSEDGSDDAERMRSERKAAETIFLQAEAREGSLLDAVFGETATIDPIYVERAHVDGKTHAAVTLDLRHIKLADGFPVHWMPSAESMHAATILIAALLGRAWVRWNYATV